VVTARGFRNVGQFAATTTGVSYEVLVRPEP
jgi:hypothetical protein